MKIFFAPLLLSSFLAAFACAETNIYLGISSSGKDKEKLVMGLPLFMPERPGSKEDALFAGRIRNIIRADLMFSRYFEIAENGPALNTAEPVDKLMEEWKKLGCQHILTGKAADLGAGWTISANVYDLGRMEAVIEKYYRGEGINISRAAHMFSDETVWRLTGKPGIAHTRIAFSNDQTGKKEIYIMDYDGANITKLTSDGDMALLPRWSADGAKIYYTTYRYGNPDMFEINLKQGKVKPFTTFQGLNIPGGISPDGKKMVMTLSRHHDPNIYLLDMETKEIKPITNHSGIDTSATYSPDGKQIAFVSDRTGNPQVHTLELESRKIKRLTRLNWCDSPSWSPSGEWIVFAGRENPKDPMNIYIIDITGNQLRKLTNNAGNNEDPSWSLDGRFIAFTSTRGGARQVYVMDYDGSAQHPVTDMKGKCYTPSWSP